MSTMVQVKYTCAMCKAENEYPEIASTSELGYYDLDTRPPRMRRNTMAAWAHECPNCGYVSEHVSDKPRVKRSFLESEEYRTYDGHDFEPRFTGKFYHLYMIRKKTGKDLGAFLAALYTAWCLDDDGKETDAIYCRELCLELFPKIKNKLDKVNAILIEADLLRRARHFEELIQKYDKEKFSDEEYADFIRFEVEKAKACDTGCYTVEDVRNSMC